MDDISRGLNIDGNEYSVGRLDGEILYSSGNILIYSSSHEDVGGSVFDYYVNGRCVRLNDLVPQGWTVFPVDGKFQVRFGQKSPHPMILFGLYRRGDVAGLVEEEVSLFAGLHEIGHAQLYNLLYRVILEAKGDRKDLERKLDVLSPRLKMRSDFTFPCLSGSYLERMRSTSIFLTQNIEEFERFDERSAWSFALKAIKRLNILSQIRRDDLQRLYVSALRSYSHSYYRDVRRE